MVYITSDLFGSDSKLPRYGSPNPTPTPAWSLGMTDSQLAPGLGKRKRRVDDGNEGPSSSSSSYHHRLSPSSRSLLKLQGHNPTSFEANNTWPYSVSSASSAYLTSERRPIKQMKRMNPKIALVKSTSHLMDIEPDSAPSPSGADANAHTHSQSDLRPCHACKTAPKRKRDLEGFMDCKRCDERTCYICARECLGCQKAICKKCSVEVGEEGDPWCLDCYSRQINS